MITNYINRCINGAGYTLRLRNSHKSASFWVAKRNTFSEVTPSKWSWFDKYASNSRCFSVISPNPTPGSSSIMTKEDIQQFMSFYTEITNDLATITACDGQTSECATHYQALIKYTMPNKVIHGTGQVVIPSYKILELPENQSPENIRLATILGWCVELLTTAHNIEDDMLDQSESRLNKLCWYKNVGLNAGNDARLVEQGIYAILKKHFSKHPCYIPMAEVLHYATLQTALGQMLDFKYKAKDGKDLLEICTTNKYNTLVKYKTGFYSTLAVRLAMYLANIHDIKIHKETNSIMIEVGRIHQLDNDIIDCFEDTSSGKVGNDISTGQCTWLIVQALQRGSPIQTKILKQNYGRAQPDCEKAVRDIYDELNLYDVYLSSKKEKIDVLQNRIKLLQSEQLQKLFYKWFEKPVIGIERLYIN